MEQLVVGAWNNGGSTTRGATAVARHAEQLRWRKQPRRRAGPAVGSSISIGAARCGGERAALSMRRRPCSTRWWPCSAQALAVAALLPFPFPTRCCTATVAS